MDLKPTEPKNHNDHGLDIIIDDINNDDYQYEEKPKYQVVIHCNNQQFKCKFDDDPEEWDDEEFETLTAAIANRFNISGSFEMFTKDSNVDIDDIECIKNEFDALQQGHTIHLIIKVTHCTIHLFIKFCPYITC